MYMRRGKKASFGCPCTSHKPFLFQGEQPCCFMEVRCDKEMEHKTDFTVRDDYMAFKSDNKPWSVCLYERMVVESCYIIEVV